MWQGSRYINYTIPLEKITVTGSSKHAILYGWLIDIAHDTRLNDEDIYSLNTAFVYALDFMLGKFEIPQYALLAETFKEQQQILNDRKSIQHHTTVETNTAIKKAV
jgi:hypothetical protein